MKNLINTCLPVLALLALGGCVGTSALTSSEDDGVYYSSKDRTTAVVSQAPAPASTHEAANPDYNGNTGSSSTVPQSSGSTQYYDNSYTYMRGVPGYGSGSSYYGPGVSTYSPYSPYTTLSYAHYPNYSYGYGGGGYGYSPYGYGGYDPFYSSYYSPYGGYSPYYGYGSGVSISFGYGCGRPYGYGYSPYSYGYSPYYYGGSYYGGYYGRSGYYGNSYYGSNYNGNGYSGSERRPASNYHRVERGSDGRYATGVTTGGSSSGPAPVGSGHVRSERAMPGTSDQGTSDVGGGRKRQAAVNDNPYSNQAGESYNQARRLDDTAQPRTSDATPGKFARDDTRTQDGAAQSARDQSQPVTNQPQAESPRRREGFFQNGSGGQTAEQPRQRNYDQPQRSNDQPQRSYDQPQRSYEQPQRSYDQPQRSYSQPSYGGGGSNGGGSNGGGGGGRRGRD